VKRHVYAWIIVSVNYHYKDPINRINLVQSCYHHYFIECNLFSSWHSWHITHFGVKQQSLTHPHLLFAVHIWYCEICHL